MGKLMILQKGWHQQSRGPVKGTVTIATLPEVDVSDYPSEFSVRYLAQRKEVSEETVRLWIRENLLKAEWIRGRYRIHRKDLREFIAVEQLKRRQGA